MINVTITINDNRKINRIKISGHADYNEVGKDIVCAAVSAITFGGLNALELYYGYPSEDYSVKMKDGHVDLRINKEDERMQIILETLRIQLESIYESYQNYIKMNIIGGA